MEMIWSYSFFILSCLSVELGYVHGDVEGCGEVITEQSGQISSPDSDGDGYYDHNVECTWEIIASKNKLIQFQVLSMSIEESNYCYSYDYLEIWDGAYFVGLYCGSSSVPAAFTSESRVVKVVFGSDEDVTDTGFTASFTQIDDTACGYTVNYRTGLIGTNDVNVNGFYPDVYCTWVITSYKKSTVVDLMIVAINIEDQDNCTSHYLEVYDKDTLVGQYCGTSLPQLIKSRTHILYVDLISASSFEEAQFTARYLISDESCGGILTDQTETVTSPDKDQDGLYDEWADCVWLIAAPENKFIEFEFSYMEIEENDCLYDFIEFYDTNLHHNALLTRICGNYVPSVLHSPSNELVIRFVSDAYDSFLGFSAIYRFASIIAEVGTTTEQNGNNTNEVFEQNTTEHYGQDSTSEQNITKYYGENNTTELFGQGTVSVETVTEQSNNAVTITGVSVTTEETVAASATQTLIPVIQECGKILMYLSASFLAPDPDQHDMFGITVHCVWEIQAAENKVIQLHIDWIDIGPYSYCEIEYLRIQDGILHKGIYCGLQPEDFISESRVVTLEYLSDIGLLTTAFKATYIQINDTVCGFTVEYRAGVFGSRGVDENGYFEDMLDLCVWQVDSGDDKFVSRLIVLHMNITCDNSLEILDVNQNLIGKYCGSDTPPMIMLPKIYLRLSFYGHNTSFEDTHFSAAYISCAATCGGILTNKTGTIVSPDEDQDGIYDADMDCVWLIVAPEEMNVEFEFAFLDIEYIRVCRFDFIEFYDKSLKFYSRLFRFCGINTPSLFTSPSHLLVIRFVSDLNTGGFGFSASYRFVDLSAPVVTSQTSTQKLGTRWSKENGSLSTKRVDQLSTINTRTMDRTVDTRTGDTKMTTETIAWSGIESREGKPYTLFLATSVICFLSPRL